MHTHTHARAPCAWCTLPFLVPVQVTVAGIPSAGIELKIVDPDNFDVELPQDGVAQGELLCKGSVQS